MQKTKLGISVGMLGAALYFSGLLSWMGLIMLGGYVLLFEENEWLRKSAVKAVAIVIGFFLINVVVGFSNDIIDIFNNILSWFGISSNLSWPLRLDLIINNAVNAAEKLTLLILGFKSFSQADLKIDIIDKMVEKNM